MYSAYNTAAQFQLPNLMPINHWSNNIHAYRKRHTGRRNWRRVCLALSFFISLSAAAAASSSNSHTRTHERWLTCYRPCSWRQLQNAGRRFSDDDDGDGGDGRSVTHKYGRTHKHNCRSVSATATAAASAAAVRPPSPDKLSKWHSSAGDPHQRLCIGSQWLGDSDDDGAEQWWLRS